MRSTQWRAENRSGRGNASPNCPAHGVRPASSAHCCPPFVRGGKGGSGQLVPRVTQSLFGKLEKPRVGQRNRRKISDLGFRILDLKGSIDRAPGQIRNPKSKIASYSRLRDQAGLPRDLVLYLARHECGTKICREKGIEYARRLLRHANISTSQRYMHLDDRELAEAQDLMG